MKLLSDAGRALVVLLVVYVLADFLLTPLARLETRDPAFVTPLGRVTLGLLFVGLLVAVVAIVLLFRGSLRATVSAVIAAVLFYPAVLAEWTGHFSTLTPPPAIAIIELVQAVIALLIIVVALRAFGRGIYSP